jgi:transposase
MTQPGCCVTGGVDTHKDVHVAAALDALGRLLGTESFPTTRAGYRQLLGWLRAFGEVDAVGVEGTGAWGAGLHRFLTANGVRVVEVMRPNRQRRRRYGKSDVADAISAARAVQAGEAVGTPKTATGTVEAIRLLRIARRSAMKARTQAGNQIHAVIDTSPEDLRHRYHGHSSAQVVAAAARFHRRFPSTPLDAAKLTLRVLARRWQHLDAELAELDAHLDELTATVAPTLRAMNGVGPQVATALLAAAGDNPDRLRSASSFAALCGASPVDASSGRQQHHRLNRGGDRQGNWALHVIIISRLRWHQPTKAYMAKRRAQGRSEKRSSAASNATSPAKSTAPSPPTSANNTIQRDHRESPLDIQRSFGRPALPNDAGPGSVRDRPSRRGPADAAGVEQARPRRRPQNDAPVLSRGGRGVDRTEIGHSWFEGRLLVGHGPRGWCGVAVDASFVEQPACRRWPIRGGQAVT